MPEYVLNRNYILRSTNGVISFTKGEPVFVPPFMEKEAVMIGAEKLGGENPDVIENEPSELRSLSRDEKANELRVVFDMLCERNDAKDFTAQGVPTVKAVEKIVDFSVDKAELNEFWSEYKLSKVEGE